MYLTTTSHLLVALASFWSVTAHIALWDKGMFGINYPDQDDAYRTNWNNNAPVNPLRESDGLSIDQWFAHGYKGFPPRAGDFMVLPAGGRYSGDVHCNRYGTRQRDPSITTPLPQYACNTIGQLHVMNTFGEPADNSKFGGTALAIAYTSDVGSLHPNDMTVISVNHNSVWEREIGYEIPAGLPPCPEGGCLCTWNWIHQSSSLEGYANEIYNILFRCQVTGSTSSDNVVQRGQVPRDCGADASTCVKGPKTPMYVYQAEGNNIPRLYRPPLYRSNWGFEDGAQNDIFAPAPSPAPTTYLDNAYATGHATTRTTPAPSATALPTGWTELGCLVDNPNTRALDGGMSQVANATIEACVALCSTRGFNYAGVENGDQCWCGNTLVSNAAPSSECNVRCIGDQWSFCGGSYRLNVYRSPGSPTTYSPAVTGTPTPIAPSAIPTGWSALGCHYDNITSRALDGGSTSSNKMTVGMCLATCQAKNMPYAGLEYGTQCFCGNTARLLPAADGCISRCGGDTNVLCGGSYRMNLFLREAVVSPSPTSTPSADSSTSASSTTLSSTTTLPTPTATTSTTSTTSPTSTLSTTTSTTTTTTVPTTTTTSSSTTSSTSTLPLAASTTTTTSVSSSTTSRSSTTTSPSPSKSSSSTKSSLSTSKTSSTSIAIVPKPTTATSTSPKASSSTSKSASTSSTSKPMTTSTSTTSRPSTTTSVVPMAPTTSLAAGWRYLGCTIDTAETRVLNGSYSESTSQTPALCMSTCQSKGFKYAGLEYGRQCYCGNFAKTNLVTSGCTTPCTGSKSLACGGSYRMNLYAFTPSTSTTRKVAARTAQETPVASETWTGYDRFEGRKYPLPIFMLRR